MRAMPPPLASSRRHVWTAFKERRMCSCRRRERLSRVPCDGWQSLASSLGESGTIEELCKNTKVIAAVLADLKAVCKTAKLNKFETPEKVCCGRAATRWSGADGGCLVWSLW